MLGKFQKSVLRIEINAPASLLHNCLLDTSKLSKWLWMQRFSTKLPEKLHSGLVFTSYIGPVAVEHQVEIATDNCLRMLLSKGIDGYHEWYWGSGWIQSRLEGISLLPLNLGQTLSLLSLREFVAKEIEESTSTQNQE